jgi:hypothetical protein
VFSEVAGPIGALFQLTNGEYEKTCVAGMTVRNKGKKSAEGAMAQKGRLLLI